MDAPNETEIVISAGDFAKRAAELLSWLESGRTKRVTVTKRGKPVAVLTREEPAAANPPGVVFGAMKGTFEIAPGVDLTAPTGEVWEAESD